MEMAPPSNGNRTSTLEAEMGVARGQEPPLGAAAVEGVDRAERGGSQRAGKRGQNRLERHEGDDGGEQEDADPGSTGLRLRLGRGQLDTVTSLQQRRSVAHGTELDRPGYS
jgi:hypothetical protein